MHMLVLGPVEYGGTIHLFDVGELSLVAEEDCCRFLIFLSSNSRVESILESYDKLTSSFNGSDCIDQYFEGSSSSHQDWGPVLLVCYQLVFV